MFTSIDTNALNTVTGGAGTAPKYLADQSELTRRSHMTAEQRTAADEAWKKTFASLSPERQAAIRSRASGNATRAFPAPAPSPVIAI